MGADVEPLADAASATRLISGSPSPMLRISADRVIEYANPAADPLLIYWQSRIGDRLPDSWATDVRNALHTGDTLYREVPCGRRVFAVDLIPIREENCIHLYADDVSERKQLDNRLRYLVEGTAGATGTDFFRLLVRHLAEALEVNHAFLAEVTGTGEFTKLTELSVWAGSDHLPLTSFDPSGTAAGEVAGSCRLHCPRNARGQYPNDARLQEVNAESFLAVPLYDVEDNPLGVLGVSHVEAIEDSVKTQGVLAIFAARAGGEIQRQRAERRIRAQIRELEAINYELDQFAHIVSHDLRAPLRAIRNLAEWIDEDFKAEEMEEVASHIVMMREKVSKLDDMVDGMLRYSRSIREEPELDHESIDLNELVADIVDYVVPPPEFKIEVPEPLPIVESPRPPLQQVLTNLIANAVKHHDRTDGHVTITSKPAEKDGFIAVTVRDDGPGLDPVYHKKVFVIFHTIPGQNKPDSTGIGLAIVQKLVEHHGGKITLESAVGEGAAFTFTWPTTPKAT